MTKKDKRDYEGPLYAPHPDINVTCHIDDEEVDCEELKYVPYVEEESYLDFLSHFDNQ